VDGAADVNLAAADLVVVVAQAAGGEDVLGEQQVGELLRRARAGVVLEVDEQHDEAQPAADLAVRHGDEGGPAGGGGDEEAGLVVHAVHVVGGIDVASGCEELAEGESGGFAVAEVVHEEEGEDLRRGRDAAERGARRHGGLREPGPRLTRWGV
jgi:hypothetical protein